MSVFTWARPTPLQIRRTLPADRRVYFISDLHLGDGSRSDSFLGKDREMLRLLEQVADEHAHLVIAGDAIDFHQAWFLTRILRAHAALIGQLSRMASADGVTYIWGNHDYDISVFRDILRFDVCSRLEIGDQVLVQHGYEYDPYIGPYLEQSHVATRVHHLMERIFKTWMRIPLENFYTPANRFIVWAFHKMVLAGRAAGWLGSRVGYPELGRRLEVGWRYWVQCQLGDSQCIFEGVRAALEDGPFPWIVTGHSHLPGLVEVAPGRTYANTGSWTFNSSQYALWDGARVTVRDWISGREIGDGAYRPLMERRFAHMSLDEWWRENYLGWFRFRAGIERSLPVDERSSSEVRPVGATTLPLR